MKVWKRLLRTVILMIAFYLSYIRWIQRYLTTNASVNNIQTMIYWGQLFVWVAVWAGAIWIAIAQIRISQEQWEIVDKQTKLQERQLELMLYMYNVENARYNLDKLTNNLDTNLLQYIAGSISKYLDKDEKVVQEVTARLKNVDIGIWKVNTTIDDAINEYTKIRKDAPMD